MVVGQWARWVAGATVNRRPTGAVGLPRIDVLGPLQPGAFWVRRGPIKALVSAWDVRVVGVVGHANTARRACVVRIGERHTSVPFRSVRAT